MYFLSRGVMIIIKCSTNYSKCSKLYFSISTYHSKLILIFLLRDKYKKFLSFNLFLYLLLLIYYLIYLLDICDTFSLILFNISVTLRKINVIYPFSFMTYVINLTLSV